MRSPARAILTLLLASVLFTSGCADLLRLGVALGASTRREPEPEQTGPVDPNITVTMGAFQSLKSHSVLTLLATVSHPYDYVVDGVRVRWTTHDDDGNVVASRTFRVPPIPPGMDVRVIDTDRTVSARNRPNRPTLEVVNSGRRSDAAPRQFSVGDVAFERVETPSSCGYRLNNICTTVSYTATVPVTTDDQPARRIDIYVGLIAKDKDGKTIGIDVTQPTFTGPTIAPNSRLQVEKRDFYTQTDPASIEAFAYVLTR